MRSAQFALDLGILAAAFFIAYLLRFDFDLSPLHRSRAFLQLPLVLLIQLIALAAFGAQAFIWRYVGLVEVRAFALAAASSFLPLLVMRLTLPERLVNFRVSVSILLMDTILAFGGLLGVRVLRRVAYERLERRRKARGFGNGHKKPVLLIGAGRAGVLAAKEILGRGDMGLDIKGFVDDDRAKQGLTIQGVEVLGGSDDIPRLVRDLAIDHVVITIADASRQEIHRIVRACERIPVKVRIIPGLYEILQGDVEVSRIRDLQVEDLLGRETVKLDEAGLQRFLAGKTVMVTGAGGSIGAELARQVLRFHPGKLLLLERAEGALFQIDRELRERQADVAIVPLVANVGDAIRMRSIFNAFNPRVILHAAAHKHVPMMEYNAAEAVRNNALATQALGELAGECGVEVFVLISTDKAVRPTSVMGASKRVAELAVQELDRRFATRYVAVRFGNVIGSAGSVITIFRDQIRAGGPVTVTHPDMERYFMTIPEAAQLVLQAGAMGEGGEIFILDMGEPVRILDLAKDAIRLSGLKPFEDIDIIFTGVRPGEKLFEELQISDECMTRTRHPKIFVGKIAAYPAEQVLRSLSRLDLLSQDGQERELREFLNELLPEARLECGLRNADCGIGESAECEVRHAE